MLTLCAHLGGALFQSTSDFLCFDSVRSRGLFSAYHKNKRHVAL